MQIPNQPQAVLEKLCDVYCHDRRQSIHYATLTQASGIANSAADEMPKQLDQTDCTSKVSARYQKSSNRVSTKNSRLFTLLSHYTIENRLYCKWFQTVSHHFHWFLCDNLNW